MADIKNFYNVDFAELKEQFKAFIGSDTDFQDYNFEGSALSQLLDVMTFGIQYQQMYLNMSVNELFPDSAQIDTNVFKIANTLNYIPKRKSAAYIWTGIQRINDILNGEVWTGATGVTPPTDWDLATSVSDGIYTIEDDSGNSSAHDAADAVLKIFQDVGSAKLISQAFATSIGKNYTFTLRYRTGALQIARLLISNANDMAGELHDSTFFSAIAGNWYLKTVNFTATNAVTYFTLGAGNSVVDESVYFDECRLTRNLSITINKYSPFVMGSLNLTNFEDVIINDNEIHEVRLYEGVVTEQNWIATGGNFQEYTLDYRDEVENDELNVFVDSPDGVGGFITSTTPWINVNRETFELNDPGYYINHFDDLIIKFGDSQRFQIPTVNDQIRIIYVKTAGDIVNGNAAAVSIDSSVTNYDELTLTILGALENGTEQESIDSIRQNAPLFYTTQNRAVTQDDHNILIKRYSKYDTFFDAFLWGGELEYVEEVDLGGGLYFKRLVESWPTKEFPYVDVGHVYCTALKDDFSYLDDTEIADIIAFLNITKIIAIFYRFLQPQIVHFSPTVNITHESVLNLNTEDIAEQIDTYLDDNLEGFNKTFHLSNLIKFVDSIDEVVDTTITFASRVTVKDSGYVAIRLGAAVDPLSVTGLVNGNMLTDNGSGLLFWDGDEIGSITYTTGHMIINQDDNVSFGLAADSTYDLDFTYTSDRTVELNRETFMKFDSIILNAETYTETN
jgi:hypothetical protein